VALGVVVDDLVTCDKSRYPHVIVVPAAGFAPFPGFSTWTRISRKIKDRDGMHTVCWYPCIGISHIAEYLLPCHKPSNSGPSNTYTSASRDGPSTSQPYIVSLEMKKPKPRNEYTNA
jgi:hypothetical protein